MIQHKNFEAPEHYQTQFDEDSSPLRSKLASSRGGAALSKSGISQLPDMNRQGRLASKLQSSTPATPMNDQVKSQVDLTPKLNDQSNSVVSPSYL